jgi:hypothetical protein
LTDGPKDISPEDFEAMLPRNPDGNPARKYTPAQIEEQKRRCLRLVYQGKTQRQIAEAIGISQPTAFRRIKEALAEQPAPDVESFRKEEVHRLDVALEKVMDALASVTDPDDISKLVDRMVKISLAKTRINGFEQVKVEGTVVQQTQTEAELEALFIQADARNAEINNTLNAVTE